MTLVVVMLVRFAEGREEAMSVFGQRSKVRSQLLHSLSGKSIICHLDARETRWWHGRGVDEGACIVDQVLSDDRRAQHNCYGEQGYVVSLNSWGRRQLFAGMDQGLA